MTARLNRRVFSGGILSLATLATVGGSQPVFAAKQRVITDRSIKAGSAKLSFDKQTVFRVQVSEANRSKVILSRGGKTMTLLQWLRTARKAGFNQKRNQPIIMTGNPNLFPGIKKTDAAKVAKLNGSNVHQVNSLTTTGSLYYCLIVVYGCIEVE